MREIKFRGQEISTGEWVSGYLIGAAEIRNYITDEWEGQYNDYMVDPATVGQFTGLKDKNGKEAYENDIVRIKEADRLYQIKFQNGCFKLFHADPALNDMLWGTIERVADLLWTFEVLGNIYENPDLLK